MHEYDSFEANNSFCIYRVRGQLGSVTLFARNIGTLASFILGASVEYKSMCICIFIPFIFGIIFVFLPSTPRHYLERKQFQVSEKNCLKALRSDRHTHTNQMFSF